MMRTMRGIAPWIMIIVAVSFVGWMIFEVGMDATGRGAASALDDVGSVNGQNIDVQTYYSTLRNTQEQQRQRGVPLPTTLEERRQVEDAVMEQLVQQMLREQEYRRRGIIVTDDEVRETMLNAPPRELLQVPEFQTDGRFDLLKYQRYLQSGADPAFQFAIEQQTRQMLPFLKLQDRLLACLLYTSDAADEN